MASPLPANCTRRLLLVFSLAILVGALGILLTAYLDSSVVADRVRAETLTTTADGPSVSRLRMRADMTTGPRDHFANHADVVYVSFSYADLDIYDSIRLLIRDMDGTAIMDHTFTGLTGTGTKRIVFTGRDAVSGLVQSGLRAGSDARRYGELALQRDSRFAMAPFIEQAFFSATVLNNAVQMLARFAVGPDAAAELALAQAHTEAALEAVRATFEADLDVDATRELLRTMRVESRAGMSQLAEVQAALLDELIPFPDTVDCRFNLTTVYLNRAPVDSIEWTVGAAGPPARIYPPLDTRRPGWVDVEPELVYTQGVTAPGAPHMAIVRGRAVDANCRPVADETPIQLALQDASLGSFVANEVTTSQGYFTATLHTSDRLGDGVAVVQANAAAAQAAAALFLVGPPSRLRVETGAESVETGAQTSVAVDVLDALGHRVADGTVVDLSVSPDSAGSIDPPIVATESGQVAAVFRAGGRIGEAIIRVEAGGAVASQTVSIVESAPTPTPNARPTVPLTPLSPTGPSLP